MTLPQSNDDFCPRVFILLKNTKCLKELFPGTLLCGWEGVHGFFPRDIG